MMDFHLLTGKSLYYVPVSNNNHHFIFEINTPEGSIVLHGDQIEFENFVGTLVEAVLAAKFTPCPDCIDKN